MRSRHNNGVWSPSGIEHPRCIRIERYIGRWNIGAVRWGSLGWRSTPPYTGSLCREGELGWYSPCPARIVQANRCLFECHKEEFGPNNLHSTCKVLEWLGHKRRRSRSGFVGWCSPRLFCSREPEVYIRRCCKWGTLGSYNPHLRYRVGKRRCCRSAWLHPCSLCNRRTREAKPCRHRQRTVALLCRYSHRHSNIQVNKSRLRIWVFLEKYTRCL